MSKLQWAGIFCMCAIPLVFLVCVVAIKVSVWNECRATHSWFYCVELTGK